MSVEKKIVVIMPTYKEADNISKMIPALVGEEFKKKFVSLKLTAADRSPTELGIRVKNGEVLYHHEVYNQMLWNNF